jgi:hypothetical protein
MRDDFDFRVGKARLHGYGVRGLIALAMILLFLSSVGGRTVEITRFGIDYLLIQLAERFSPRN